MPTQLQYNTTLQTNNSSLEEIITQLNNMPEAVDDTALQDKTVSPSTSKQIITADDGFDGLDSVIINAIPTVNQASPSVDINTTNGLITACGHTNEHKLHEIQFSLL